MFMFNNREEYIEFRKEWKKSYRALTVEIQHTRAAIKEWGAKGQYSKMSALQSHKAFLRNKAHDMMETLVASKIEAANRYKETHTA